MRNTKKEYISRLAAQSRLNCDKDTIKRILADGMVEHYVDEEQRVKVNVESLNRFIESGAFERYRPEPKPDSIIIEGNDHENSLLAGIDKDLLHKIQDSELWESERFNDIPLTKEQMISFIHGYAPDFDCRYAPYLINGWFYIARSNHWVKKFKYKIKADGLYHVVSMYTTDKEKGRDLLAEIICSGYFRPAILDDRLRELFAQSRRESER